MEKTPDENINKKQKKNINWWMIVSIVLFVLVIASVLSGGFWGK